MRKKNFVQTEKLGLELTMTGLGKPFRKNIVPKNRKKNKYQSEIEKSEIEKVKRLLKETKDSAPIQFKFFELLKENRKLTHMSSSAKHLNIIRHPLYQLGGQ